MTHHPSYENRKQVTSAILDFLPCLTGKTLLRNDLAFPGSWLFPLRLYPLKLDGEKGPSPSSSSRYGETPSAASETYV